MSDADSPASDGVPLHKWLHESGNLPSPTTSVELKQTHISWVFLADDQVYKLKKPVAFDFLDFSTVEHRRQACEDELRLNRRLAADIYLDVLPLFRKANGEPTWDSVGEPVDWVVHMRRMPDERMMDRLIEKGAITQADTAGVAKLLAAFYRSLPAVEIDPPEYRRRIEAHIRSNDQDMIDKHQHLPAEVVKRITSSLLRMLKREPATFDQRVSAGRVIEGHGDLRPEHVCLTDPPVVFDCIEFSTDFRTLEVADELSFFAMECDYLDVSSIGQTVIEQCTHALEDDVPPQLINFYKSYRACVRSKVAALRSVQLQGDAAQDAHHEAESYLQLADRCAEGLTKPLVLVVAGLMGTGKSTLAQALALEFVAEVVQTDAVRREMFGASEQPAQYGEAIYSPENRSRVYEEVGRRVAVLAATGMTSIADGTFSARSSRETLLQALKESGADAVVVHCHCPRDVAAARIADRQKKGASLSEARPELLTHQEFERPNPGDACTWIDVDTTIPLEQQVESVSACLKSG